MKVLIVRLGSLGDIIHTIPAQQHIFKHLPGVEIHWLAERAYESLLRQVPGIAHVWITNSKQWRRQLSSLVELAQLVRLLRSHRFDVALDFQGLNKSAMLARLARPRKVVGFASRDVKERAATWFYTEKVSSRNHRQHVVELNFQLAHHLGCPNHASALIPLEIPSEAIVYVEEQLNSLNVTEPVLLNPGAGWMSKLWPARNYASLFLEIERQLGLPAVFTYGPGEEHLIAEIGDLLAPLPVPAFPTSVLQLAALCKRSRLFVGGDTGPLHLAVALGTPTVSIMGPTSPWRNGPYNPEDIVVKRDPSEVYSFKTSSFKSCPIDLPVEDVLKAVIRRLKL